MRFELLHPGDPAVRVAYGLDHALPGGFFASIDFGRTTSNIAKDRALVEYDAFQRGYSHEFPLRGCLEFLAEYGVFTLDDLNEAIVWFELHGDRSPPKKLRLVVEIIANLKKAADS